MAQNTQKKIDSFTDLERYRQSLEENVIKLQKSLQHWQTWEAEYEGLKEEILRLGDSHTKAQLKRVGDDFGGEFLNDEEIKILLEDGRGKKRDGSQVIGLLNRRIDYVQENVKSVTSLLRSAELKATASSVISHPEVRNQEGLPLTEIREELDDEGNVICTASSSFSPNEATPQIFESLRKSGVTDLLEPKIVTDENEAKNSAAEIASKIQPAKDGSSVTKPAAQDFNKNEGHQSQILGPDEKAPIRRKKSVSFAEGTKTADATDSSRRKSKKRDKRAANALTTRMKAYISDKKALNEFEQIEHHQKAIKGTISSGDAKGRSIQKHSSQPEVNKKTVQSNAEPFLGPVLPIESPEDAALRRQMIKYNMEDVGAVVAEMDLDNNDSDSWSDEYDKNESQDDDSLEEDEDEFGRTKRPVISKKYQEEMEALEQRLNAKFTQKTRSSDSTAELEEAERFERVLKIENREYDLGFQPQKTSPTKEVRFADEVGDQIATAIASTTNAENDATVGVDNHSTTLLPSTLRSATKPKVTNSPAPPSRASPLLTPPSSISPSPSNHPLSHAISSLHEPASKPPSSSSSSSIIINDQIIERPYTNSHTDPKSNPSPPSEPDEFDPPLLHQQAATEYHRMRNRMIHRQGGFLASAEEEAKEGRVPLGEEEGGTRKISRFKAARLRKN